MKKSVLAAFLSGVMVATNAVTAFATDVGEEIILLDEEETSVVSETADPAEENEEEIDVASQEESDAPEQVSEDVEASDAQETAQRTVPATGHRSACKIEVTNRGGDDDGAFFNEEYPAKYVTPALPPLRNQGNYGTCWAHASLGLLEINMMKSGLIPDPDFSELHLAHFYYHTVLDPLGGLEGDYFAGADPMDALDLGGDGIVGLDLMSSWCGAASEDLLPYSYAPLAGSYGIRDSLAYDDVAHIKNFYVTNLNREKFLTFKNPAYLNPLKKMVMEYGAADISFGATNGYSPVAGGATYNEETGAYYNSFADDVNHEVVVVGWDDNYPKENFTETPPKDGAFLVRNSWADEGDIDHPDYAGYFWMSYYEASLGEQIYGAEVTTADNYDNNYQYDAFLFTGMGCVHKGANVFTAHAKDAEEGENLKAVSVFILDENSDYTVEVYRNLADLNNPESGTKEATVSGTSNFAGRYTVPLNKSIFLKPGETFSVVVTTTYDGVAYDHSTGGEQSYYGGSVLNISAKEGQSFSYEDGEWKSMEDNLKIKAYTDNVVTSGVEPLGIRLDNISDGIVELGVDESLKINYTVYPISAGKNPVTVVSSDPEVASVSGSKVTAVSEGNAVITLSTANGKTASFEVVVTKKLKQVIMNYDGYYYDNKLLKCQCYYTLDPEDYVPVNVTWESSDESVVSVDPEGLVTFNGLGAATVTVTVDGVRASAPFYSVVNDSQVYYEVSEDNVVYIKWEPLDEILGCIVNRNGIQSDFVSSEDGIYEIIDTYYRDNPVDEPTVVDYELWFQTNTELIPYTFTVRILPEGADPKELPLDDWGDICDDVIMEQFEYDLGNVPDGMWYVIDNRVYKTSANLEDYVYTYTGKENTLYEEPSVYYKNKLLSAGRDYSLTYKNNVNASDGGASFTITGKGEYKDKAEFTFSIEKASLEDVYVIDGHVRSVDIKKKKKLSSFRPVATFNGMTLKAGQDFNYEYYDITGEEPVKVENPSKVTLSSAGMTYEIRLQATENGNFTGEECAGFLDTDDFTGAKSALSFSLKDSKGKALKVSYDQVTGEEFIRELLDNSEGKTPAGYVYYKGKKLVYGEDFYIAGADTDYKTVGPHSVSLGGNGEYKGCSVCSFEVVGYDISKAKVAGLLTKIEYTGYNVELTDLFDSKDKNLEETWDKVTLYTQDKTGKVKLAEMDEFGNGDYKVTFKGARNAGKYTLTFTGTGRCTGELKKTITIAPYDIKKDSKGLFYVNARPAKFSKAGIVPKVEVTFGRYNELILKEGSDYTLSYKNNSRVAEPTGKKAPTVIVKGTGNFKGTRKDSTFRIFKGNVLDMKLEVKDVKYNPKGKDGYFISKFKLTEGGHAVLVGKNKDIEPLAENEVFYEYVNDAEMEDGTIREAGTMVDATDRPLPGTVIDVYIFVECSEKSPYYSFGYTMLSQTYEITK